MNLSQHKIWGYRRENGRVGVRNYVAILPLDDISNAACEAVASHIQGTIALPHAYGRLQFGEDLDLRQMKSSLPAGILLALVSYALCLALIAPVAHQLLGLSWKASLIVAAVLGGVSASVSLPVLQTMRLRSDLKIILTVEGAMADILSVLTVTALLNAPAGTVQLGLLARSFAVRLSISLILGIMVGVGWAFLLPRLSDRRFWQVLTFGAVLVLFAVTEVAGGGDLLAVLIFWSGAVKFTNGAEIPEYGFGDFDGPNPDG